MSRATVTTFGRGVSFVASGETGTQANEFEAAIKSVTSATTVGAVFVYDTRNDSDSGAWRKKARGSWYYETLNTATRGGRREFPSVALIVADNASANTVKIYDLDDPSAPMWMVFNAHTAAWETNAAFVSTSTLTSVHALNGRMYVGGEYGLVEIDFITEQQTNFRPISGTQRVRHKKSGAIVDRNDTSGQFRITATPIANNNVNDVAAKYLEGGELDSLGLVRPVVACATASGVSVIHPNGSVADSSNTNAKSKVDFTSNGSLLVGRNDSTNSYFSVVPKANYFADSFSEVTTELTYTETANASAASYIPNFLGSNPIVAALDNDGIAVGSDVGLNIYIHNSGNKNESAVAFVTSDYNSGYQLGDIRFAGLANHWHNDRSVKGNHLTENGSISNADVATDAELKAYSGFSASNYLSRAYDADFDLGSSGTVMAWVKVVAGTAYQAIMSYNSTTLGQGWQLFLDESERAYFYVYGGNGNFTSGTSSTLTSGVWHQIVGVNTGSRLQVYVNGKLANSSASGTGSMNNSSANLNIGVHPNQTSYPFSGSISLARISATVATPQQVKEMYDAEAPLFQAGAKCLLQSDHPVVSNTVRDLSFDESTGLLSVSQSTGTDNSSGVQAFRGLERVSNFNGKDYGWDYGGSNLIASAGGVVAPVRTSGTGGVIVDLPPFDVRGDTNIADSKSSNDGKIRFTGVTASTATPTVIGHIPLALGDKITVKARVQGHIYQYGSLNGYYEEITATFQRPYDTGTVAVHTSFSNPTHSLSDTTLAGLDVELNANDTAKTCEVKVTGSASYRMQWNATVEVQRITEKTYER